MIDLEFWISFMVMPILGISLILVFIRFLIGPSISDRVVSLDLLVTVGIGLIITYCILTKETVFIDFALILALLGFLSTVAFAYYIEKKGEK